MGGLGARDRLPRVELERVVGERVVRAQAELAGDDLGAEVARRVQARAAGDALDVGGDVGEAELRDEAGVEGGDRDGRGGARGDRRLSGQGGERGGQLRAGERALAVEAAVVEARQHAGGGDSSCWSTFQFARVAAVAVGAAISTATAARTIVRRRTPVLRRLRRARVERCVDHGALVELAIALTLLLSFGAFLFFPTMDAPPVFGRLAIGLCVLGVRRRDRLGRRGECIAGCAELARTARSAAGVQIPALTAAMLVLAVGYGLHVARRW